MQLKHNLSLGIIVDECDTKLIQLHKFSLVNGYARATVNGVQIYLHRLIVPNCTIVDHKNGIKLYNRRGNLRPATGSQNNANKSVNPKTVSGYKGVVPKRSLWRAQITINGICRNLGSFVTKEEAAPVYDIAAKRHFGEFAKLNFDLTL